MNKPNKISNLIMAPRIVDISLATKWSRVRRLSEVSQHNGLDTHEYEKEKKNEQAKYTQTTIAPIHNNNT